MATLLKRQNLVIVTGSYTNNQGQEKKKYKTIGELVTMKDDKGETYQFGEIFYPNAKFSVYDIKPRDKEQPHQRPEVPTIQQDTMEAQDKINIKNIPF